MYQMLKEKCDGLNDRLVDLAGQLIRIPSPSLEEKQLAARVRQAMTDIGYDPVITDEFGNVVGVIGGRTGQPTVLLNSHMDTLLSSDTMASEQLGRIEAGRLYGPGAADCKGGLAAQIMAGALLKRSLLPLRGNLVVAATTAESNGMSVGVRGLLERTLPSMAIKPDYAILGEPTNLGLYYGHDGWMEMEIRVEGNNPFYVDDAARAIASRFGGGVAESGDDTGQTTSSYGPPKTDNGLCRSVVRIDRRLTLAEDVDQVARQVRREVAAVAESVGTVTVATAVRREHQKLYNGRTTAVRYVAHAWATDPFCPLMDRARQVLAAAGCPVRPGKWQLGRLGMGTAGGVLVNEFHVPTIGFGPGNETQAHCPDEYVELSNLSKAVYGTAALVHGLVGIPVYGWTSDEI
jgi:acetylornithine deacetylase/succinyl-diaminopimelate desuccinylase-like protein